MNGSADASGFSHATDLTGPLPRGVQDRRSTWAHRIGLLSSLVLAALGLSGCGLVVNSTVVVLQTATIAGYAVYKGGETVVSGASDATSSKTKDVERQQKSVVVSPGRFKTQTEYPIAELHTTAMQVFSEAGFTAVSGQSDTSKATVQAETSSYGLVTVRLEVIEDDLTEMEILVDEGGLRYSEYFYDRILRKVEANRRGK